MGEGEVQATTLWDRKVDGGFPETKVLKGQVRDLVVPDRKLGHTDRALGREAGGKGPEGKVAGGVGGADGKEGAEVEVQGVDAEGNAEMSAGRDGGGHIGRAGEECVDCR
jgi:hypothetical protein